MRYNIIINQLQCVKYGLNEKQGALMDLIGQLNTWADSEIIANKVYYNLSYSKIIAELPLIFKVKDTVYRSVLILKKIGLIEVKKIGRSNKNYVRLTPKGKLYFRVGNKSEPKQGSEINPSRVGNKSEPQNQSLKPDYKYVAEQGSEINPTYNNNTTNDKHKKGVCEENLKDYAKKVGSYFGKTSEVQQMKVYGFLKSINLTEFKIQFEAYKKYKAESKEKIHRFESFCYEWDQQDWSVLFKNCSVLNNNLKVIKNEVKPTYLKNYSA
ncbi:hypothetical protein ACFQZW_13015 [Lutibacter aestuarii]|uniref:Helix-turn-helix domain-containing protein n=1 Tax=Lutibacter aestuarii TaxID=861111 RepID=A0ABW2Z954_9FLAO